MTIQRSDFGGITGQTTIAHKVKRGLRLSSKEEAFVLRAGDRHGNFNRRKWEGLSEIPPHIPFRDRAQPL